MNRFLWAALLTAAGFAAAQGLDQAPTAVTPTQAEDIYSQALNFSDGGNSDQAVRLLKYLLSNGYTDSYIYYAILDQYAQRVTQMQIMGLGSATNTAYLRILSEARNTAGDGLKNHPGDVKLLYRYADFSRNLGDTAAFTASLREILKTDDADIFANYWLGSYQFLNRNFAEATKHYQKVVSQPMVNREFEAMALYRSYYHLGMISVNEQKYRLGLQYLEKARSIYSRDQELMRYLALTYAETLDWDKAVEAILEIPAAFRTDELTATFAGVLFLKDDGRLEPLIAEYAEESVFIRALSEFRQGLHRESLESLDEVIRERQFADFYTHYLLFRNYEAMGDRVKSSQQAFLLGNRAKEVGRYELAAGYYKLVERNTNSIPEIYWLIGSLYDDSGNRSNAIRHYEKYLSHKKSGQFRVPALVRLSYLYSRSGRKKQAESRIRKAKSIAKKRDDRYQVYFYSGLMLLEGKKPKEAARDLQKALQANRKGDSRVYFFLATALYELGDRKGAMARLEEVRSFDADNPEINNLLAYLYSLENTRLDEALRLVNLALIASPDNLAYLDTLGWVHFRKGDWEQAYDVFGRVRAQLESRGYPSDEGFDEIYFHLGMVYKKAGRAEEALKFFRKGLAVNPKNALIRREMK